MDKVSFFNPSTSVVNANNNGHNYYKLPGLVEYANTAGGQCRTKGTI
jgi:hypothetical protein